jgi:NADH-quinone oxidoreductase subunit L
VLATLGGALNLPQVHSLSRWLGHTLGDVEIGEFRWQVAALSTGLGLLAIGLSWVLYGRRPLAQGADDPLRRILGPLFAGMERKWGVDEAYNFLFVQRYVDLAAARGCGRRRFWRLVSTAFWGAPTGWHPMALGWV